MFIQIFVDAGARWLRLSLGELEQAASQLACWHLHRKIVFVEISIVPNERERNQLKPREAF